jgi:hypothetical protein
MTRRKPAGLVGGFGEAKAGAEGERESSVWMGGGVEARGRKAGSSRAWLGKVVGRVPLFVSFWQERVARPHLLQLLHPASTTATAAGAVQLRAGDVMDGWCPPGCSPDFDGGVVSSARFPLPLPLPVAPHVHALGLLALTTMPDIQK